MPLERAGQAAALGWLLAAGAGAAAGGASGAGTMSTSFGKTPSISPLGDNAAASASLIWSGTNVHELLPCRT